MDADNSDVNSPVISPPSKAWGRPFRPGQSGNPNGRPPISRDVRALARRHTEKAIETLVALLDHDNPHVRKGAADSLLDRGHGRPEVSLTAHVETTHTIDVEALRASMLARAAGLAAGRGGAEPPALPDAPAGRVARGASTALVEVEVAPAGGEKLAAFTPESSSPKKLDVSTPGSRELAAFTPGTDPG